MNTTKKHRPRLPEWLRSPYKGGHERKEVGRLLEELGLNTVCTSAKCPNLCKCWEQRTATFMIMGNTCTRNCRFCAVSHETPLALESDEPARIAEAAARLNLKFVVITSVTRDDLPDGGAQHFAAVIRAIKARLPQAGVEVLTSDFQGNYSSVDTVLAAKPNVFNHNLETCHRLTDSIRSGAQYNRSLAILKYASKKQNTYTRNTFIKSGFMLGLGETVEEIREMLQDLSQCGVQLLTIGQYLPPSRTHWELDRYVHPDEFDKWKHIAETEYSFRHVVSAPLVRSSYMAEQAANSLSKMS